MTRHRLEKYFSRRRMQQSMQRRLAPRIDFYQGSFRFTREASQIQRVGLLTEINASLLTI
jgi:hypothetical protein